MVGSSSSSSSSSSPSSPSFLPSFFGQGRVYNFVLVRANIIYKKHYFTIRKPGKNSYHVILCLSIIVLKWFNELYPFRGGKSLAIMTYCVLLEILMGTELNFKAKKMDYYLKKF